MDARMLYLHALSPIHSGTAQSTEVIDLPVVREAVTHWPYIPGSSVKGVLRDACAHEHPNDLSAALFRTAFGPDTQHADEGAGALWFADARLLCLPVRSYYGSFAWATCPLALRRWQRDHLSSGMRIDVVIPEQELASEAILVADASAIRGPGEKVFLEEFDLNATVSRDVTALAESIGSAVFSDATWQSMFRQRFAIVNDDLLTFLTETSTEVFSRIKLNARSKSVEQHGLWYEEAVPAESIFSCPLLAMPRNGAVSDQLFGLLEPHLEGLLQIGGNASVGRGLVVMRLVDRPHPLDKASPRGRGSR